LDVKRGFVFSPKSDKIIMYDIFKHGYPYEKYTIKELDVLDLNDVKEM
jgi:hypothetical protein